MRVAFSAVPHRIIVSDDDAHMSIGEVCERFRFSPSWFERKSRDELLKSATTPPIRRQDFGGTLATRRLYRLGSRWAAYRAAARGGRRETADHIGINPNNGD